MFLYLSGAEHNYYRYLLQKYRIRNVCVNFSYMLRMPKMDWVEELASFDKVMVYPGNIDEDNTRKLVNFLDKYDNIIDYCIDVPKYSRILEETDVPVIPVYGESHYIDADYIAVNKKQTNELFFKNHIKDIREQNKVHGIEWLDLNNYSCNTSSWILGMRGLTFYFDGKHINQYGEKEISARTFLARTYNNSFHEDFDIDLVKRNDWKEVARLNLFAWKEYINSVKEID